jgi:hypothetical protein
MMTAAEVGLDGLAEAFEGLVSPNEYAKIIVGLTLPNDALTA